MHALGTVTTGIVNIVIVYIHLNSQKEARILGDKNMFGGNEKNK
jgi:hypothetical protein